MKASSQNPRKQRTKKISGLLVSRFPIETSRSSPFNDELRNRNIEITQINNDLTNLLATINVGVGMLGNDLTIRRFTPPAQKFFNLLPTDVRRRFGNINPRINGADLQAIIAGVLENLFAMEKEVTDQEGNSYLLQVLPYRSAENRIDGVVITVLDGRLRATSPLRKDAARPTQPEPRSQCETCSSGLPFRPFTVKFTVD